MILPITIYGSAVLRKKCTNINPDYPGLQELIENMFETMYNADGVGLAAPQIDKPIRLFIVDASPYEEDEPALKDFKRVFINAEIIEREGEPWAFNEGCLSIPGIREDVLREPKIRIKYFDENFQQHDEYLDGTAARIVMHEYDHIEGILFTDKVAPIRRRILKKKLEALSKGKFELKYKVKLADKRIIA